MLTSFLIGIILTLVAVARLMASRSFAVRTHSAPSPPTTPSPLPPNPPIHPNPRCLYPHPPIRGPTGQC